MCNNIGQMNTAQNAKKSNKPNTTGRTGFAKSVKLDDVERAKFAAFGLPTESDGAVAARLGISRQTYLRVKVSGSARGNSIRCIKAALKTFEIPTV